MRKTKVIRFLSFFLPLCVFFSFLSGSIFLYEKINLYPLKFAFFDISGTLCSIRCIGNQALFPLFLENLKIFALSLFIFSFLYALFKTIKRIYRTKNFVKKIKKETITVSKFGINTNIFEHNLPLAFTAGFFKPEIYLSTSLTESLNEKEIKGIIFHEIHHKEALHPLKNLIISFISDSLFFLPISRFFKQLYLFCIEIFADMNCISNGLTKEEVALSFLKVCKIRKMENSWFYSEPLERVKFLFEGRLKIFLSAKKIIVSIVLLILLAGVTLSSVEQERFKLFLQHRNVCGYHKEIDKEGGSR